MSLNHSPKVVTNGLVLYTDMSNTKKSWLGAPTTNLIPYSQDFSNNWNGNLFGNWINSGVTTDTTIAPDNTLTADTITGNYGKFTNSITASVNTSYTFSCWVKNVSLVNPLYFHVAFGLNGALVNYNNIISIPVNSINIWSRYSITVTSPASGINQIQCGVEFGGSKMNGGTFAVAAWGAQVEVGSFATPYIPTTTASASRSTTQAILDLTGNYVLTPTNLSYSSSGTFSFVGSSYIDLNSSNIITGNDPFTVEAWYTTTGTTSDEIFGNYGSSSTSGTLWISGRYGTYINGSVYFPGAPLGAGTYFLSTTRDTSGNVILYKNGVQVNSGVLAASIPVTYNFRIGADVNGAAEPFTGSIHSVKVYNRVLTAAEIAQNFNAHRSRYGI